MTNPEKQIKSRFAISSFDLVNEIVNEMVAKSETITFDPEVSADTAGIIHEVFEKYEVNEKTPTGCNQ